MLNPLFIPEHRFDNTVAAKAAFAIGHYEALGFSPFSIESRVNPEEEDLGKMNDLIAQLSPLISANQGCGKIEGVLLDKDLKETVFTLGKYEFTVKHSHTLGWEADAKNETWEPAGALFIQTGENEFFMAGSGITATFNNLFENNQWRITRHLNGDQTHQGRHVRIFHGEYAIQRLELYNYK